MKIALVVNDNFTMWQFFRGLIEALVKRGFAVYLITPSGEYTERLEALGARHIAVPMSRFINPVNDLLTLWRLYKIFRRGAFDIVHNIQIKPTVFGAIAARMAGAPRVAGSTAGLGYPFFIENPGLFHRSLAWLILHLMRLGSRLSDKIWFQNGDDLDFFVTRGVVPSAKAVLIRSNGVNVEEYSAQAVDQSKVVSLRGELDLNDSDPIVTMVVARLIWSKGVKEFLEALRGVPFASSPKARLARTLSLLNTA